ncbi:NAD-dependent epimerase/dehydratase family protein [Burkholderia guangdongensis]|uniref:NAD-dependent epimerase/dehydratase family protein n=1 Tax=Burkholderia guangdongensis TaxID=1792500 RepID=UPI0015CC6C43|nr:NAD(P)-dependent oxidoreductase [Burkholderia guangdongensis]
MKVLVTGAAGFLGKECVKQLKGAGYDVVTTDKVGSVDVLGDLSDSKFVSSLPDVDAVVNCAAVQYVTKGVPLFMRKPFFYRNNVQAASNLYERYHANGAHFVHVGTSMMYRQTGQPIYSIGDQMGGEGVYSWSKTQAQIYIDKIPGAATVIPCIIGGEGREGLFRGFVSMMKRYGMVIFPGTGSHKVHMVHVVDVASLIVRIIETRASGFYNAAAPDPLSIREWIDEIADELAIRKVRKVSLPLLPIHLLSQALGYRLLAREQLMMLRLQHVLSIDGSLAIGWKPKFSNARIARDIAKYIVG